MQHSRRIMFTAFKRALSRLFCCILVKLLKYLQKKTTKFANMKLLFRVDWEENIKGFLQTRTSYNQFLATSLKYELEQIGGKFIQVAILFHPSHPQPNMINSFCILEGFRGTQRIVSVNYLFGRPLISYNFLKGIFTTNFRDMGNLRPSVFGLIKMLFRVPKKGKIYKNAQLISKRLKFP